MVTDEASPQQIKRYLHRFFLWWVIAAETWTYEGLIKQFLHVCWDVNIAAYAAGLLIRHVRQSHNRKVLASFASAA